MTVLPKVPGFQHAAVLLATFQQEAVAFNEA